MNAHRSSRAKFLSIMLLALGIAASASASLFVVTPPKTIILPIVKTYNQAAADWWKWVLAQPVDTNPLLDATGAQCGRGQPAFGVWYLAGSGDGSPVERSCTVPNLRTLLIPVINNLAAAFPDDPANQRTEAFVRSQARLIKDATDLSLTIDGTPVRNLNNFYEESSLFNVTLPANNIYELPTGQVLSPAVDAGYYVAVSGLLPGNHTITWHAQDDGFEQDVTYNIRINLF